MITLEDFMKEIKEVCLLTGQNPSSEQLKAIHKKLQEKDLRDFIKACKNMAYHDVKITLANLYKHINEYEERRLEREAEANKKAKEAEIRSLMTSIEETEDNCKGGDCGRCMASDFCKTLHRAFIRTTISILTGIDKEKAVNEFSKKFKNSGLEEAFCA